MALARHNAKPWGKLVHRDILVKNGLWFPENLPHEDIAFICACFIFSQSFGQCFEPLYYYRQVSTSLSHSNRNLLPQQLFATFVPIRQLLQKAHVYDQVRADFEYQLIHMIIGEENSGSGRLKYMSVQDMKNFAAQVGNFFDTLPNDIFADKKYIFRFKWNVLRFALRHRLYRLPRMMRPVYKLAALF